jgi:hypothetical protein
MTWLVTVDGDRFHLAGCVFDWHDRLALQNAWGQVCSCVELAERDGVLTSTTLTGLVGGFFELLEFWRLAVDECNGSSCVALALRPSDQSEERDPALPEFSSGRSLPPPTGDARSAVSVPVRPVEPWLPALAAHRAANERWENHTGVPFGWW